MNLTKLYAGAASIVLIGLAIASLHSGQALAAGRDENVLDQPIAVPAESGVWRTKMQAVFDPVERTLVRRKYVVWDANPSRDLDFVWLSNSVHNEAEGKVNGEGRLIWRVKGSPTYDRSGIFAEYRGTMRDGRPEGHGSYLEATGLNYSGEWKNGVMDGVGRLIMPGGDEYLGEMRNGRANGAGRYIEATGEIFDGRFVDGQREGAGTTTLPNGNSYRSIWVRGRETEGSRGLRVAQLGGLPAAGTSDDIRVGITIDKSKARDGDLVYATSSEGAKLLIRPDNKRLMEMWKGGGEIQLLRDEDGDNGDGEYGVFSLSRGQMLPLTLVFEVQNRSSAPISVSGAYLSVAASVTDPQPAIQLHSLFAGCGGMTYLPTFRVENFGWGAASGAKLGVSFVEQASSIRPGSASFVKQLGDITKVVTVDLEPELRSAGVRTATLRARSDNGFVCTSKTPSVCLGQLRATGAFGSIASRIFLEDTSIYVRAAGSLDYAWRDAAGAEQQTSSPYSLTVPLGHVKIEAECGEGGPRDPITARPLSLKLDQSNYRLPISFQRSIPPGQTSRYTVTITAPKSSSHDFSVVLQLANGREIRSRPINLLYYVPSWFAAQ